jgi:hypothetical protein
MLANANASNQFRLKLKDRLNIDGGFSLKSVVFYVMIHTSLRERRFYHAKDARTFLNFHLLLTLNACHVNNTHGLADISSEAVSRPVSIDITRTSISRNEH